MTKFKNIKNFMFFFNRLSLRHKIVILIIIMVILPMSIAGVYFYYNISSILTKTAYQNLNQLIGQTTDNLNNSFRIIDNTSFHFASNNIIRSWAGGNKDYEHDLYKLFLKKSEIEAELKYSLLFNDAWDSKLITTAYLFIDEDNFCSLSRSTANIGTVDKRNINLFNKLSKDNLKGKIMIPPSSNDQTLYFTRSISNLNNQNLSLRLIIGTNESVFYQKYQSVLDFPGSKAFIMDESGIIYSHPDKKQLGQNAGKEILALSNYTKSQEIKLNNYTYLMAFKKIKDTNLIFVTGIPKSQVLSTLNNSMSKYLIIIILILLSSLIISVLLSLKIVGYIKHLINNIRKVSLGNYEAKMPEYEDPDLNILSTTFNNMTSEIKYLVDQIYEKQLLIKDTELKFLQSQMNPHFLFNALFTIGWKAKMSRDESIYKMVTSLSELLRASLYNDKNAKIPIHQELEYIKFYLYIQKVRFEDKLQYEINIEEPTILECFIPKLSVEPLVENAVVHGIEKKIGNGNIIINIKRISDNIYIEIIDDGVGFNPDILWKADGSNRHNRKTGHNNIALFNINSRIKLVYGEQYGIKIDSTVNSGTKVVIQIPVDKEELT